MRTFKTLILAALAACISSSARSMPVYNDDDRQDVYEVQDPRALALADSAVALFPSEKVIRRGNRAMLATESYQEKYNLCEGERFSGQISGPECSGVLVGPDMVLTAGHCVENNAICVATSFVFGFALSKETSALRSVPSSEVYSCSYLVGHKADEAGADWALVRLDRAVKGHRPLKIEREEAAKGTPLMVIGYPNGLPAKIADGAWVISDSTAGYFTANLDTFHGNSGAPVFNAKTEGIVGVLVRGEEDFETVKLPGGKKCMKTKRCYGDDCRGEDVTKASEFSDLIPDSVRRPLFGVAEGSAFSSLQDLAGGSK